MEKTPDITGECDTHVYVNGEPLVGRNKEMEGNPGVYEALDLMTAKQDTLLRVLMKSGQSLFLVKTEIEEKTGERLSALEGWTKIDEKEGTATPVTLTVLEPSGSGSTYLTGRVVLSKGEVLGMTEQLSPNVIEETDAVSAIVVYPAQQSAEMDPVLTLPELVSA
jgi:hypothetical protein